MRTIILTFTFTIGLIWASFGTHNQSQTDEDKQRQLAFEQVFGDKVRLDPEMIQKVLDAPRGERHYVDRNGDGSPDEAWFIDTAPRHSDSRQPLLVRAIDKSGDLEYGGEPNKYNTLYVADWNANGKVNAVIDYTDVTGNRELDQMGMYTASSDGVNIWWSRDDGGDNLLWYDENYVYSQSASQQRTHFNGDESFYAFRINEEGNQWISHYENPFLFWDRTGNGLANEVLRVSGLDYDITSIRWSFDADNDATEENPRDYDVSITATSGDYEGGLAVHGTGEVEFGEEYADYLNLRGIPTGPMLARDKALEFIRPVGWDTVQLVWVENDNNIHPYSENSMKVDRWEGVLAHPSDREGLETPMVGGPSVGPWNNRNEVIKDPDEQLQIYFNPASHRIHLKNAEGGWLDADFDYTNEYDMGYEWHDTHEPGDPGHGYFDRVTIDVTGDGEVDDSYDIDLSRTEDLEYTFDQVHEAWAPVLRKQPARFYRLNRNLEGALETLENGAGEDEAWDLLASVFDTPQIDPYLRNKWINSDESVFYYMKLAADRRIYALKNLTEENSSFWEAFNKARSRGETERMTRLIAEEFDPDPYEVPFVDWLRELRSEPDHPRVAWEDSWLPPNFGWESEKIAYRIYEGHIDVFGKTRDELIFPEIIHREDENYHEPQEWGMDILLVGQSGGAGGVTLYVNGESYPVRSSADESISFETRLLSESNERVIFESVARGVGPEGAYTVRMRPTALAGTYDSPIEVVVEGGRPGDQIELGVGLNKMSDTTFLSDKQSGVIGIRGWQDPSIGWIGTGVVFPASRLDRIEETDNEYQAVLEYELNQSLTYHIQADWLRARQYPVRPSAEDWLDELKETAQKAGLD